MELSPEDRTQEHVIPLSLRPVRTGRATQRVRAPCVSYLHVRPWNDCVAGRRVDLLKLPRFSKQLFRAVGQMRSKFRPPRLAHHGGFGSTGS